jgi:hypothetical protein
MSKFVELTQEEIDKAAHTSIKSILEAKGEKVIRSGNEWAWEAHDSVKFRDFYFYQHSTGDKGTAIEFMQLFFKMSFPDAVCTLINKDYNGVELVRSEAKPTERKEFKTPQKSRNMRRTYAYLMQERCIDTEIISFFVHHRSLYESANTHNVVFVGCDANGVPKAAHEKGTLSDKPYQRDVPGSSKEYFFNYYGGSDRLYVFEAPIDLMSFLCLHKEKDWQKHNYIALGGLSDRALARCLIEHPSIKHLVFCLDNDYNATNKNGTPAPNHGQVMVKQLCHDYGEKGYEVSSLVPRLKDWNEDLKAKAKMNI